MFDEIDRLQELSERIRTPNRNASESGRVDAAYGRPFNPHRLSNGWPVPVQENTTDWAAYAAAYEKEEETH